MGHTEVSTVESSAPPGPPFLRIASASFALVAAAALVLQWLGDRVHLGPVPPVALLVAGLAGLGCAGLFAFLDARAKRRRAAAAFEDYASRIARLQEREAALDAELAAVQVEGAAADAARAHLVAVLAASPRQALFVDAEYRIANVFGDPANAVFAPSVLGRSVLDVFASALPARAFDAARDRVIDLFDAGKPASDEADDAFAAVELDVASADGGTTLRTAVLRFRRVGTSDAIAGVLVDVEDVTERVERDRAARSADAIKAKNFALIASTSHLEGRELDAFVALAKDQLSVVDGLLGNLDPAAPGAAQRLAIVRDRVRSIRGDAERLRLRHFESKAALFERRLDASLAGAAVGGDDFLDAVACAADFRAELDALQALRLEIAAAGREPLDAAFVAPAAPHDALAAELADLACGLAARLGKTVVLDAAGFDASGLDPERRAAVKDVLEALARNSIVHGIESAAERSAARKPAVGTIRLRSVAAPAPHTFAFSFRDDGRGLEPERIRAKAAATGLVGAAEAAAADESELAGYIFVPGFSTAEPNAPGAGRGMGMSVVKQRVIDEFGGEIGVNSEPGRFCEFSFELPAREVALAS
jgi:chemotaxis protein histidine kinase CheA